MNFTLPPCLRRSAPVIVLPCLLLAASAQAQTATESFSDTTGASLSGQSGGTGWSGAWTATGATIASGNLSDPTGKLTTTGNSVAVQAAANQFPVASRNLASTLGTDGTTVWFSFTIRRTAYNAAATNPPAYGGVALGSSAGLFVGDTGDGKWGMDTSGPNALNNVVDTSGSASTVATGTTTFLVVRADFKSGNDTFTLYQNPTPGQAAPDVAGVVKSDLNLSATSAIQMAYGNGSGYTIDELRVGTSYAAAAPVPASAWTAMAVSTGADGLTRLLWDKSDGTASVWKVNASGQIVTQQQFGPYQGWTAKAIATGKDNQTRLLWTNTNGAAAYYLLDANNAFVSQQQYGPYSGWTAQGMAVEPDNSVRSLWTNSNGTATIWTLDSTNHLTTQAQYGPYAGWTAKSLTANPDGTERLLWANTDGTATFWRLSSVSQLIDQHQYGPYIGYTAQAIAASPDGTGRVVWGGTNAHIALWTLDSSNTFTSQQSQYGPYAGFSFQAISVGTDGNARLLWDNTNGQAALWSLTPSGSFATNYSYGPY